MKEARYRFYEVVLAKGGCYWKGKIDHVCDGPIDPMHIIPKQWLKGRFSFLPDEQLAALVFDPRNGTPGCRSIHGRIDGFHVRLGRNDLPEDALSFARAYELDWKLDLLYPGREDELK